ncbi:hypothetical protein D915_007962 [Fasciola hepatica]|uniref:DUF1907 domain-containing protein n=1 Tax=Fasciola hepatica TaxID=6192 RepID=A0A4E0R6M8_FASHE|nr:hypothetical protein D915_007962 [Fasciola hepatica]
MIFDLHCPKLDDIAYALQSHLKDCFSQARCSVVDCPDLTKPNFGLTKPGLGGSETLCDFGSFDYLLPTPDKNKVVLVQFCVFFCSVMICWMLSNTQMSTRVVFLEPLPAHTSFPALPLS